MKKLMMLVLSCMVGGMFLTPINAKEVVNNNEYPTERTFQSNEYLDLLDEYKSLTEFNVSKVNAISANSENSDLDEVRQAIEAYPEYIRSLQSYTNAELSEMNYTESQISAIRNYDGSVEMTAQASASVSGNVYIGSNSYNSSTNRTTVTLYATAYWNGVPFVRGADTLGIGLVGSESNFLEFSSYCYTTRSSGVIYSQSSSPTMGLGNEYKFGIPDGAGVISSATMAYTAIASGNETLFGYGAAYSHHTVSSGTGFGFSISSEGGITLSFTGYSEVDSIIWDAHHTHS